LSEVIILSMHTPAAKSLFLFDIDGTLLRGAPPIHREAICAAARAVYGVSLTPEQLGKIAGMTDSAIARRALRGAGVSDDAIADGLPAFFVAAIEAYERTVPDDLSAYHTPHAAQTLDWLAGHGAALGLVTGNIQRIAWSKLGAAGLAECFRVAGAPGPLPWIGAFGDEAEDRDALPPLALARAAQTLRAVPSPENTWIVGDTVADIACGQASGLGVIAVATGHSHTLIELRAHNPTHAIADLTELASLPLWGAA
jgi:phosphoglycolate phosphatase-like HAD superfamily hydrolase